MKFHMTKKWLLQGENLDENPDFSAGGMTQEKLCSVYGISNTEPRCCERVALCKLINHARRRRGLTLEKLASEARVELDELEQIEHTPGFVPEIRSVHNLANVLKLPVEGLMELSGLKVKRDVSRFEHAAVKFAAYSSPNAKLSAEETRALDMFITFLDELTGPNAK